MHSHNRHQNQVKVAVYTAKMAASEQQSGQTVLTAALMILTVLAVEHFSLHLF